MVLDHSVVPRNWQGAAERTIGRLRSRHCALLSSAPLALGLTVRCVGNRAPRMLRRSVNERVCLARLRRWLTPLLDRSNRISMRLSWRMQRLIVDCLSSNSSGARRKLPYSAAANAYRKYRRSIVVSLLGAESKHIWTRYPCFTTCPRAKSCR